MTRAGANFPRLAVRVLAGAATLLAASLLVLSPAPASAAPSAPRWSLFARAEPTSFEAGLGGCGAGTPRFECANHYTLLATNVGGSAAEGTVTIDAHVPGGLAVVPSGVVGGGAQARDIETNRPLSCASTSTRFTCVDTDPIPPGDMIEVRFAVEVEAGTPAGPLGAATATVEGGGAAAATASAPTLVLEPQPFGLTEFSLLSYGPDGSLEAQAGGHPDRLISGFAVASRFDATEPGEVKTLKLAPVEEGAKDAFVYLPLGMTGNPTALPTCPLATLQADPASCPLASRLGSVAFQGEQGGGAVTTSFDGFNRQVSYLYNLTPEHGYPAEFGFIYYQKVATLHGEVVHVGGPGGGYALRVGSPGVPAAHPYGVLGLNLTFFGDPAARDGGAVASSAFLRNPTDCAAGSLAARMDVDSWGNPHRWTSLGTTVYPSPGVTGCDRLRFQPTFLMKPVISRADTPSGYEVDLRVPQAPAAASSLATPDLKQATVTLPAGVAISPSAANGLAACQATGPLGINIGTDRIGPEGQDEGNPWATELGAGHLGGNGSPYDDGMYHTAPGHCPDASRIGDLEIKSPLLEKPLTGHVYVAAPECAPCDDADAEAGRLYGIYLEAAGSGVIVKLRGKVTADPRTGQLAATFAENPQLPFEDFKLRFYGGTGAVLANPELCGSYTTSTDLTPWSTPYTPDAAPPSSFVIDAGAGGSGCAGQAAQLPNAPSFEAGTSFPNAGEFSPFVLRLRRADGTQRLRAVNLTLPAGLLGRLASIPYCPSAQITAAARRGGHEESAVPSCPAASEVGTVTVGAGPGEGPYYVTGHAYLAGPYKGAPLSLAIITPAVAGPFDLGTVVVRSALYVDPETARITVRSDPIPTILAGTPLDVRSIDVEMSRPKFTLNPTNCEATAVGGQAISTTGNAAPLSNRFQVGGCRGLDFKPRLKLRLKGATKRTGHPALKAVVTYPKGGGQANIRRAQVNLPHGEFLDQGNIDRACTKPVLLAGNCPKRSVYGHAKAWTPLLAKPLQGPVYLVGGYGYELPALVAELNGQIRILLVGRVDSGKNKGIRNTFEVVPDAPVSRFTLRMKGGKKYGLLENSENLCKATKSKRRAIVRFVGHNGKVRQWKPLVANSCGKAKKRTSRKRKHHSPSKFKHHSQ